jgi:hypothetical protein
MPGRAEMEALGPDLYGGTSGVALFLAEASARLDDDSLRATALGAIRLALDQADRVDRRVRDLNSAADSRSCDSARTARRVTQIAGWRGGRGVVRADNSVNPRAGGPSPVD